MTDYPAPETLSHKDLGPILDNLRLLLENLPNQLPSKSVSGPDPSRYASLVGFQPDDELQMTGTFKLHEMIFYTPLGRYCDAAIIGAMGKY